MNVEDKNHVDDLSCIYNYFDGIGMLFVVYQDIERPTEGECQVRENEEGIPPEYPS
jgi:hypothetical protein